MFCSEPHRVRAAEGVILGMCEVAEFGGRGPRSDTQPNFVQLATPAVANCYEVQRQGVIKN